MTVTHKVLITDLVNELVYSNYRYNREISPHITPERWEKVYGAPTKELEKRYQKEVADGVDKKAI